MNWLEIKQKYNDELEKLIKKLENTSEYIEIDYSNEVHELLKEYILNLNNLGSDNKIVEEEDIEWLEDLNEDICDRVYYSSSDPREGDIDWWVEDIWEILDEMKEITEYIWQEYSILNTGVEKWKKGK